MKTCPSCGRTFPDTKRFCNHCGTALPETSTSAASPPPDASATPAFVSATEYRCPSCGKTLPKTTAKFCRFCGVELGVEAQADSSVPFELEDSGAVVQEDTVSGFPRWPFTIVGAVLTIMMVWIFWPRSPKTPARAIPPNPPQSQTARLSPPSSPPPPDRRTTAPVPSRNPVPDVDPGSALALMAGLVAYYPFDGRTEDISGLKNHGAPPGAFAFASNSAFSRESLSCFAPRCFVVPDSPSLRLEQFSLAMWLYRLGPSVNARILQKGNPEFPYFMDIMDINVRGSPSAGFYDGQRPQVLLAPVELGSGDWHFLVGTYDGVNLRFYVDGRYVIGKPAPGPPVQTTTELYIGSGSQSIDKLAFYRFGNNDSWRRGIHSRSCGRAILLCPLISGLTTLQASSTLSTSFADAGFRHA